MAKQANKSPGLWLFKQEPGCYAFDQLLADGKTVWDGVGNNTARLNLWKIARGDRIMYYHTGKEKAVVGEAKVIKGPYVPKDSKDDKAVVVEIRAVKRWANAVTLKRIKQEADLADWELVRLPRLSVVPVTQEQWRKIEHMSQEDT